MVIALPPAFAASSIVTDELSVQELAALERQLAERARCCWRAVRLVRRVLAKRTEAAPAGPKQLQFNF